VETIVSLANITRRHSGLDAAVAVYQYQIEQAVIDSSSKAALVAEWARLLWRVKGAPEEARQVFQRNQNWYLDSPAFWSSYLRFEIDQATTAETEDTHYAHIKKVVDEILTISRLSEPMVQELMSVYMKYLLERGTKDAAKEYLNLDREINGPTSVQKSQKTNIETSKTAAIVNGQARQASAPPMRFG
jgi:hypothetical protein